jgi:hypothetical protein
MVQIRKEDTSIHTKSGSIHLKLLSYLPLLLTQAPLPCRSHHSSITTPISSPCRALTTPSPRFQNLLPFLCLVIHVVAILFSTSKAFTLSSSSSSLSFSAVANLLTKTTSLSSTAPQVPHVSAAIPLSGMAHAVFILQKKHTHPVQLGWSRVVRTTSKQVGGHGKLYTSPRWWTVMRSGGLGRQAE